MQNERLRRAQTALRARYFDLYDRAPVCYIIIGEQELIIEANLTTANLLGVARGVLVKQPLSKFIFKEDKDILYRHIKHPFKADAQQAFDIRMVKNDRTVFWAHLTTMTVADVEGNLMCRVSMSDITERKKVEEALRERNEELARSNLQRVDDIARDITERKWAEKVLLEKAALRLANAYNRHLIDILLLALAGAIPTEPRSRS